MWRGELEDGCSAEINFKAPVTHFDVKLHFGDEQFEVDAAQLPIAFTQMTLKQGEPSVRARKFPFEAFSGYVVPFPK